MRRPFYYDPGANPQPRNYRLGTERFTPSSKVQPNEQRRARKALQRAEGISGKAARRALREARQ